MPIVHAIQHALIARRQTLAVAESCTGGAVAAAITAVPGASLYFLGGIVAYSDFLKEKLLHVPPSLIADKGAVSSEAVEAMLQGLFEQTGTDYGVAISGIAGPSGGAGEKPVGTVWVVVGHRQARAHPVCLQLKGERRAIIHAAADRALEMLCELVTTA